MNQNSIMCTTHGLVMAYQYFLSFFQPFFTLIIHFLSVILPNLFQRYTCISMRSDVKRGNCTLSQANCCHSTPMFLIYFRIIYKNNNSHSFTHILRENTTHYIGDALVIKVSECVELLRLKKLRVKDLTIQTYPTYMYTFFS